jgi:hypothetical protein
MSPEPSSTSGWMSQRVRTSDSSSPFGFKPEAQDIEAGHADLLRQGCGELQALLIPGKDRDELPIDRQVRRACLTEGRHEKVPCDTNLRDSLRDRIDALPGTGAETQSREQHQCDEAHHRQRDQELDEGEASRPSFASPWAARWPRPRMPAVTADIGMSCGLALARLQRLGRMRVKFSFDSHF